MLRYNWTIKEAQAIYDQSLPELIYQAQTVQRQHHQPNIVQRSTLLSVKTGNCPEDCLYCPQSARYKTNIERHGVLAKDVVIEKAREAIASGSTRLCMGASWREVREDEDFEKILELVREVSALGLEVCCTFGMLTTDQAQRLKDAGCTIYNHNLDTSPEFYGRVITTRTYQDRLNTLKNVRAAGLGVCCGGIIGLGESVSDRLKLLVELATLKPHPESVPINMLVRVEGTPLAKQEQVEPFEFVRVIACARIMMPQAMVRLSAGRTEMSDELQALCFLAGANSIFSGERLLTTPNPGDEHDLRLLKKLGMEFMKEAPGGHH